MKTVDKWLKRIQDTQTPWSESDIIYFRRAIGPAGIKDRDSRGLLMAEFEHAPAFRITRNHDVKGQAYILSKSLKVNGERRKGCKFSDAELKVFKELEHHLFFGVFAHGGGYLPVYRAVSIGGDWVDYVGATYELIKVLASSVSESPSRQPLRLVKGV